MSKKRADINAIVNELEGGSLFFKKPSASPPPSQSTDVSQSGVIATPSDSTPKETKVKSERSDVRTDDGTFGRKLDRMKGRHAFDIYADQPRDLQTPQLQALH